MGRLLIFASLVAVAGCSFTPPDLRATDDAGPGSGDGPPGAGDAPPGDGPAASACLERWRTGPLALSSPMRLASLGSPEMDRDPFVTPDERTIYFSSYRAGASIADVYVATRGAITEPFAGVARRDDLTSQGEDSRATMTGDELIAVVSAVRADGVGGADLWLASRGSKQQPFGPLSRALLGAVNTTAAELDPELGADGLHLYLAIGAPQRIAVATRATTTEAFGAPVHVPVIGSDQSDSDPSLASDERVIVFGSHRNNDDSDLWYAARATTTGNFGVPVRVPNVNGSSDDGDPALSADGCRLYFASVRSGNWEIYVSAVEL